MSVWIVYRRRSNKKLGSERVAASADVSDQVQLEKCLTLLPPGAAYEVIDDLGGHQSGRSDKRDGWRAVIARVEEGGVDGIAAFDISRLARNARLVLNLHDALQRTGADLRIAQMPGTDLTSAQGKFLLTILAGAAAFQADYDSERMRSMMRATYESGGHRGNDPFGYATIREDGRVVHPRTLEVVPEEAVVVQRAFELMVTLPFADTADALNREGALRRMPGPWTNSSVKDLWRRREFYIGRVTTKRGLESREGKHPAILSEDEYRTTVAAVTARMRKRGRKSGKQRTYLLRTLVWCECGVRMTGEVRLSRGDSWRYYACPIANRRRFAHDADGNLISCHARRVQAAEAEAFVIDAVSRLRLPREELARADEQRRQAGRTESGVDKERARLTRRLEALRKQHEWGEITDESFRKAAADVRTRLAGLPSEDGKASAFGNAVRVAASWGDAVAASSTHPEIMESLLPLLVERIEVRDRHVAKIDWTPEQKFVFRSDGAEVVDGELRPIERPRTESNRRRQP